MQLQRSGVEQDTRFTCLGCSRVHSGERYDDSAVIVCQRVIIQRDNLIISQIFLVINYGDKYWLDCFIPTS